MSQPEILLVEMPSAALGAARQAARLAFPEGQVTVVDRFQQALQCQAVTGTQLLVLANSDPAAVASATQALDAGGLPRWAVVILGPENSDFAESVALAEWNPPLLARVFRSALQQHELMCENLRLRGDLKTVARRISHDLRTPVGCIQTTSYLLKELDPAAVASMAGVIRESSQEIAEIIDRVSVVLKASTDPSPSVAVKMGPVVSAALRQLEPEIQASGAVLTSPATWPEVMGVGPWLQVIWWNLVSNALRHGGPVPQIGLAWRREDDEYRFSVTDGGPGVAPDRQAALFSPFDQLHELQVPGLGLSLTKRLVTLQRGRCGYEQAPDGGACFHFSVPAAVPKG